MKDEVDFFVQMSIRVIYKLIESFLMAVTRHATQARHSTITQIKVCKIFATSQESYGVGVLHADKHGNPLKVHGIIFDGFGQVCSN